jgi:glycosyltransferase involved in cell wall biosynthesis
MLAIVIPYFKLTFFEATLQSLANQTDKRFRVYIGDDASPENPITLLEKYKGKFDFVYHRFDSNLGTKSLVQQWHRCIALVQDGEWLLVLGDDDVLQDNFAATFYENRNEIDSLKINVIRYATVVINEKGEEISNVHKHPKLETSIDFLMRKLKGGTRSSLSEFIFRKKVFDKVKFKELPLAWYSDYLAVLEVSNFSTMFTINNSLVSFRLSGLNITSKRDDLKEKSTATFGFYHYLLKDKKEFLNAEHISVLLARLEKTFSDNKKNVYFWFKFTKLYLVNFYFKQYAVFIIQIIYSYFKKNKQ